MDILVACEESQRVCCEFLRKGHNVFSCDLFNFSGIRPDRHILCDVRFIVNGFCTFKTMDGHIHFLDKKWDLIIAFPPCTYFSRVNFFNYYRNGIFNKKRFNESKPYVDLFYSIYNANCDKICIENPLPISLFKDILPPYSMKLQPYEFGEPYSKLTCLWLKGLPPLMPTVICSKYSSYVVINGNMRNCKNITEQSIFRSKTFLGVAVAMAEQWGVL